MMNKCSAVAEMGDRLTTIDIGRKLGEGCAPYGGGKLDPHVTQSDLDGSIHTKWHLDPSNRLATIHQRHRQADMQYRLILSED